MIIAYSSDSQKAVINYLRKLISPAALRIIFKKEQ